MELHGANAFKIRGYQNAIFNLDRLEQRIADMAPEHIASLDGIGKSIALALQQLIEQGTFDELEQLRQETPPGIIELLGLKGIGPKKIKQLWEELHIETPDDLFDACQHDRVAALKGFGKKTQDNILEALAFRKSVEGQILIDKAEALAEIIEAQWKRLGLQGFQRSGDLYMLRGVVTELLWLSSDQPSLAAIPKIDEANLSFQAEESGPFIWRFVWTEGKIPICIRFVSASRLGTEMIKWGSSERHLALPYSNQESVLQVLNAQAFATEAECYQAMEWPQILPELREGILEAQIREGHLDQEALVTFSDLKGILHNHSTYSDGKHSLREMAEHCRSLGYEYLGITDHSKSAFYAGGLDEAQIKKQHTEIDRLNEELAPFKIFKGIESDILGDGSLDYAAEVLASFDFIVSSIHSQLGMDEKKATDRLIKAIANPFTTQLGHPTGRLLLRRKGYPIDHKAIIEACAHYDVSLEINAHPWRLDLDWSWVPLAMEKGVKISINPDAHEKAGYAHMRYGVYAGRKGGLSKTATFNALSREEVEAYFIKRKKDKGITPR